MNMVKGFLSVLLLASFSLTVLAEGRDSVVLVRENKAHDFGTAIPAGNYSGIVNVKDDLYALVSDKGKRGAIVFVRIKTDRKTGNITSANHVYTLPTGVRNMDYEDIVYCPQSASFFIACEENNEAMEFSVDNFAYNAKVNPTGKILNFGGLKGKTYSNRGMESLAYDAKNNLFWTIMECPLKADGTMVTADSLVSQPLRLISTDSENNIRQYAYLMDAPEEGVKMKSVVSGVSAITALADGRLLVLEREVHVPEGYLGAFSVMKIYVVDVENEVEIGQGDAISDVSPFVSKQLVCSWRTSLGLLSHSLANYEGMCLAPQLDDGSQVIMLVSDSQNQFAGVLSDWFKTIVISV
ncbi:MAG: esterase-like activity of phytase family protein [Prevotella sp.]|uniref:esterase-like activity of phytase family protein n=1 Tax=Prevotella sp. TaxID=59823 RepID=UPI002A28809D|nr:esterase-like activity of phytase family protein [Prevotella sp.]MDD7318130.1 esterase-like activity of phytase family protein [Prevotellaceae bacterium]MDY4020981.1 esterase-like activity of phytase family protein [Prevotella sp.]